MAKESTEESEGWFPKTREEFAEVFADGMALHTSRLEEEAAKAAAANPEGGKKDDGGDNPPARKPWGQRFLGG